MNDTWEGKWKEAVVANSVYYLYNLVDWVRKTTNDLCQDTSCSHPDSNRWSLQTTILIFTNILTCSVNRVKVICFCVRTGVIPRNYQPHFSTTAENFQAIKWNANLKQQCNLLKFP